MRRDYLFKSFLQRVGCDSLLSLLIRISILLAITTAYALFDVFNKRNVPDYFVYASLAVGIAVMLTYGIHVMEVSAGLALAIGAVGFVLYRIGVVGAGDFFEFATISLLLPIQPAPLLSNLPQFGFPFVFSVFISTGYAAVIGMLVFYLARAYMRGDLRRVNLNRGRIYNSAAILFAYLAMLAAVSYFVGVSPVAVFLILTIAISSSLTILFEKQVSKQMITYVYPSKLVKEDMIAVNFMSKEDRKFFSGKSPAFGRLVTPRLIKDIRRVRKKVPLYTSGAPLALFALVAVVISLLFGNILLYIII